MMGLIWFWLVALMLALYVILDGFDLGVGSLHFFLARTSAEREISLRTIGPVWDGNEVWLIAGGGTLYFAFPLLYASAFSGFYLPLMIVLWLLILRGIGIELRMHIHVNVWQDFFDGTFALSSALLTIFLGAALANVIRGVPLGPSNYFFLPLWTNWRTGAYPGILDWYTVLGGVLALVALAVHGAFYFAVKTEGELQLRARRAVKVMWPVLIVLTIVSLAATIHVRPGSLANYLHYPVAFAIPLVVFVVLGLMPYFSAREQDKRAFVCTSVYLGAMLTGAAFGLYPTLMPSTLDSSYDITVANALSGHHGLSVGLIWWGLGMILAAGYFIFVYRMFRGKVQTVTGQHGYL
ncbi:MAG: cytochrome d ubiquinol oxidase subunit II [Silvibacterium sp.]